jgi:hypothetical protein
MQHFEDIVHTTEKVLISSLSKLSRHLISLKLSHTKHFKLSRNLIKPKLFNIKTFVYLY